MPKTKTTKHDEVTQLFVIVGVLILILGLIGIHFFTSKKQTAVLIPTSSDFSLSNQ